MNTSETLSKLAPALVKAQAAMAGATKSAANPFFKSKYANLEEVIRVVKEPFAANGLSFVQFPISGEGTAGVETIILHESGEFISNEFHIATSLSMVLAVSSFLIASALVIFGVGADAALPSSSSLGMPQADCRP